MSEVQHLIDYTITHWDSIVAYIAGISAWLYERQKRKQEKLDAGILFWEKTIDRQNSEIARLEGKVDQMRSQYEGQIQVLVDKLATLTAKLEVYESQNHKTIHTL